MFADIIGPIGGGIFVIFYLAVLVLSVVAWVKILNKAGYSGWWVLVGIVPVANVVMFFVFAFGRWPALRARADT